MLHILDARLNIAFHEPISVAMSLLHGFTKFDLYNNIMEVVMCLSVNTPDGVCFNAMLHTDEYRAPTKVVQLCLSFDGSCTTVCQLGFVHT